MHTCYMWITQIYVLCNSRDMEMQNALWRKRSTSYTYYKCKLNKLVKLYYSGMWDQFTDEVAMVAKVAEDTQHSPCLINKA